MGKSKSYSSPNGERRRSQGRLLAPRSLRKKGRRFLSDCTDEELEQANVKREDEI